MNGREGVSRPDGVGVSMYWAGLCVGGRIGMGVRLWVGGREMAGGDGQVRMKG